MRDYLRLLPATALLVIFLLLPASGHAQQNTPRLSCQLQPASVPSGQQATLIIELADVQNIYGYELKMTYEAGRVQALDQDAGKDGVNLQLGSFLTPDFVLFNTAENGSIQLALTQLAPATGKSGSGELARTTFQAATDGFANFVFGEVTLSDANGQAISVATQDCLLEIGAAGQPTPTFTPQPSATPTGTAVPAATQTYTPVPVVPTATPWPTATGVPPSATPVPSSTATAGPTATSTPTPTPSVVIITTPLQTLVQPAEVVPAQVEQPTLIPTINATSIPESAVAEPTASNESKQADIAGMSAEEETTASSPEPSATVTVVESTQVPTATPTPTKTPQAIAQIPHQSLLPVEAITQPQHPKTANDRHFLYQSLGWASLLVGCVFAFFTWLLRKNQSN